MVIKCNQQNPHPIFKQSIRSISENLFTFLNIVGITGSGCYHSNCLVSLVPEWRYEKNWMPCLVSIQSTRHSSSTILLFEISLVQGAVLLRIFYFRNFRKLKYHRSLMSSLDGCVAFTDSSSFNFGLSILHSIYVVCCISVVQSFTTSSVVKIECFYIRFVKFLSSYHSNTLE